MKHLLSLLLVLCGFLSISAQEINFEHLGAANGLSQISVMSVYQDELGYMWFGTAEGLNRYDGRDIEVFRATENDQFGLTSNIINKISGDNKGHLYLLCGYKHLVSFDIMADKFTLINNKCRALGQGKKNLWYAAENKIIQYDYTKRKGTDFFKVSDKYPVTRLFEASNNKLYVGTENGLCLLDDNKIFNVIIPNFKITAIYEDSKKNIWVGTAENGVFKVNWSGLIEHYFQNGASSNSLSSNIIRDFCEDNFGQIWIATFMGLDRLTPESSVIVNFKKTGDKPTDLSHTSIYALFKDRQGTIWIGTYYGGINYYNHEANIYTYYYPNVSSPKNINFPFVGKMTEDKAGNLWICTEGGGLNYYDRRTKTFQAFKADGANSISHNNLKCIWYNPQNEKLYIGTHMGGVSIYDSKRHRFNQLSTRTSQHLPNDVIEALCPYKENLIILTQKGIVQLNLNTETVVPFFDNAKIESIIGSDITTLLVDSKQNLWLAQTDGGVKCYNLINKKLKSYSHAFEKTASIGRHAITRIYENKKGKILFATKGSGLYEYLPQTDNFRCYNVEQNGLLSDFIYDITETNYGYIVLLTNKGVNLFDPESNKTYSLDKSHGLPLEMINFGCGVYVTRNGEIFVGGTNGMASFFENQINSNQKDYNLFFSDIYVNNQLIRPTDKTGILLTSMPYLNKLKLSYDQTNITIKFATSNYIKANKTAFEYKLVGFEDKWMPVAEQSIKYSNLSPGSYVLHVREVLPNSSNVKPKEIELQLRVSPPFYASNIAYIIYLLLIGGAIWWIISFNKSKILLQTSLEYEIKENDHIKELNQAKLQFFTNISHEFRTPLTLIIGQIESMTQMDNITPSIYNRLSKIYKNATHLRILITELLDFRKQEHELLSLKVSNQNIVEFVKNIYLSFNDLAASRKIEYTFFTVEKSILLWYDPVQLQKVFYNLISNAFKYSQNNSSITIKIEKLSNTVRISVIDSGIGISEDDLPKIFDRFYQAKNQIDHSSGSYGTGIGLALSKGIVELHHGTIVAEKKEDAGTMFRVSLLTGSDQFTTKEKESSSESDVDYIKNTSFPDNFFIESIKEESDTETQKLNSTILIVEDNEEMLHFLSDIFSPIYHVETAIDGLDGLEKVKELQPDIVLSDVMMPRMSGKEMCMKLKTNFETSHIPIVLLTADSSEELNLEGLMVGADDYITKPFNVKMLISRCNNLVISRKRMQDRFSKQTDNAPISIATNKMDQDLLNKATEIVMKHLDDYDFDVTIFAQEMALGRSKLYLKLKGIIGMTPNDFILNIRLKTAATLLTTENELNISDITYRLGFNTPRYFSKCFKELFGISPLNYRKANNPAFANKEVEEESDENEG